MGLDYNEYINAINSRSANIDPKEMLNVFIDYTVNINELREVWIEGETNLPDGMKLMIDLNKPGELLGWGDRCTVENGKFETIKFSDPSSPGNRMQPGEYEVNIHSAYIMVQSESVKNILGQHGEYMTGTYVVKELNGNLIDLKENITIK